MSRHNSGGDFDVITGPPVPSRKLPPASLPNSAIPAAPDGASATPAAGGHRPDDRAQRG